MTRYYQPFPQVQKQPGIIVDSLHPNGLVLAHWRGAPTPSAVRGDSSAECVLNALHHPVPGLEHSLVTANHFDIDGFVGVWALLHPEEALRQEAVLREMALIGDFRELDLSRPGADTAMKLVCWINAEEMHRFYAPFGAGETEQSEMEGSVPKFEYFLAAFGEVLQNPDHFRAVWEPEYRRVRRDYDQVYSTATRVRTYPAISLVVIETPEPIHYYALFSPSVGYDIVLSLYSGQRYEMEYKYTTWIDLVSRPTLPRLSIQPLIRKLNVAETQGQTWQGENVTDTGPILRVKGPRLSKMQRYAHPPERPIAVSSLPPDHLENLIISHFEQAYAGIPAKKDWTWAEIKALNTAAESERAGKI